MNLIKMIQNKVNSLLKKKMKIFTVDDVEYYSKLIEINLEKMGYDNTKSFISGEDVIKHLKKERPNCIILDHKLSDNDNNLNGIDTLKIIKDKYPNIHVIILTGRESVDIAKEVINEGATDFILKNGITFLKLEKNLKRIENTNKSLLKITNYILLALLILSCIFLYIK